MQLRQASMFIKTILDYQVQLPGRIAVLRGLYNSQVRRSWMSSSHDNGYPWTHEDNADDYPD
jgi:hypothetical protein